MDSARFAQGELQPYEPHDVETGLDVSAMVNRKDRFELPDMEPAAIAQDLDTAFP